MKLKQLTAVVLLLCLVVSLSTAFADSPWIDVYGQNLKARLVKKWAAPNLWFVMKWSKDWSGTVGAWLTNHYTWYSNDYNESTWYGYSTLTTYEEGAYRIEELYKMMRVSDDKAAWAKYKAAGASALSWGAYDNGVPIFILLSDTVTVYKGTTNQVVKEIRFVTGVPQGLGRPAF